MKSETTFIYALADPETGETRYVGKADDPRRRYLVHLAGRGQTYVANWIAGLKSRGQHPQLQTLIEVPQTEWQVWEREIIRAFRSLNVSLTNLAEGGIGGSGHKGHKHSDASKEKMRVASLAMSDETKAKMRAKKLGKQFRLGKKHTAETKEKLSLVGRTKRGDKNNFFGRKHSEETKARIRQAKLSAHASKISEKK